MGEAAAAASAEVVVLAAASMEGAVLAAVGVWGFPAVGGEYL
jgi:hypothetical protein